ncbi:MAG: hypothetical protein IKI98_01865, partial [Spirochaetaceae bacterium]|nr:hypothetical protein [Spirochaetaceae bacterium]
MKKFLLSIFSIFLSFSLFAFDFGGSVQNDFSGRFISSKINLDDKVDVSFWFKMPLDFQGNTTLNFETAYIGDFVQKIGFSNYFDIRKLNIKMRIPLSTSWNCIFLMGRQDFSDISTQIYHGKLDQLSFDFNFDFVNFNILAGYTGLLNGYTHNTFVPVEYFDKNKFYIQNKIPAVIFEGKITLNKLFNFSPISLEFLNISVLQPENQNNLYINLQLNRELTEFHSFNVFTSFLFSSKNENKIANFTKAHFSYKKENREVLLKGLFASNLNEKLSAFEPYSLSSVSKIKNIPLSNLVSVGGSFLVDISKSSIFSLDMNPFFNFEENTSKIQYTG